MNKLYFGDCLDILKKLYHDHPEGFIDLIYIDPPFNSKRNYNILFEAADLKDAKAQKEAFADTWSNVSYKDTLEEIKDIDLDLYQFIHALDSIRISASAVAYLTTMAIRIWYMHKVLKNTGSFYLHCDPTMSHYLKIICDLIFNEKYYRNEITWKRTFAHSDSKRYSKVKDIIFFYTKSSENIWNNIKKEYKNEYIQKYYHNIDQNGRRFAFDSLIKPKGSIGYFYELLGCVPPPNGWRMTEEKSKEWIKQGRIEIPPNGKIPRFKRFIDEMSGLGLTDIWDDLSPINSQAKEALGYPTQKPIELLERIISASSNEGDLVADFFCGCGTTIDASQKLGRNWIGVDISHLAVGLIGRRLADRYGPEIRKTFVIDGMPKDIGSAKELAITSDSGRFKFQDWIIEAMLGGVHNPKKTADGGWDGHMTFEIPGYKEIVLIEVKSGNVNVKNVREFIHVVDNSKSAIGVFVCFAEQVTKPMLQESKNSGYYRSDLFGTRYDRIQILTVEDLLDGKTVDIPRSYYETFKKAKREDDDKSEQMKIF